MSQRVCKYESDPSSSMHYDTRINFRVLVTLLCSLLDGCRINYLVRHQGAGVQFEGRQPRTQTFHTSHLLLHHQWIE